MRPRDSITHPFVIAISGASGAVYATRLIEVLLKSHRQVHLTITPSGRTVLEQELGLTLDLDEFKTACLCLDVAPDELSQLTYHHVWDFSSPLASGSALSSAMVICPCSGRTLSAVAHGASSNLIQRAADVHLKERRTLILVPRETPLSLIHLDNMRRACEAGAVILPAAPAWYQGVTSVADLVDFVVARILDQLHVEHALSSRWGQN